MNKSFARAAVTKRELKNAPATANIIVTASLNPPISPIKSKISVEDLILTVLNEYSLILRLSQV